MTRKILFKLDGRKHRLLRHLSLDTGRNLSDLLDEAAVLLLMHHGVPLEPLTEEPTSKEVPPETGTGP